MGVSEARELVKKHLDGGPVITWERIEAVTAALVKHWDWLVEHSRDEVGPASLKKWVNALGVRPELSNRLCEEITQISGNGMLSFDLAKCLETRAHRLVEHEEAGRKV